MKYLLLLAALASLSLVTVAGIQRPKGRAARGGGDPLEVWRRERDARKGRA